MLVLRPAQVAGLSIGHQLNLECCVAAAQLCCVAAAQLSSLFCTLM